MERTAPSSSVVSNNNQFRKFTMIFPMEIWLTILHRLPFNDTKTCRLVSRKLKCNATLVVIRISRRLIFDSTGKLQEFLLATPHPTDHSPFPTFQFNLSKLTTMGVSLLRELVKRHGKHVRELRFLKHSSVNWTGEEFYCAYAQCLSILLSGSPNLECLKLNIYDYRLPRPIELVLPGMLFHLKRLKVRLMFTLGTEEGHATVKKLIQTAPCLEEFTIHCTEGPILNTTEFLRTLPEMLTHLPSRCKVGLRDLSINDSVKDTMESLRRSNIKLFSADFAEHRLQDPETFRMFWSWIASSSIRKLQLCRRINLDAILPGPRPISFESCKKLRLQDAWSKPLLQNGHFIFPNLNHLTLSNIELTLSATHGLSIACPQIQRLSCEMMYRTAWELFTQNTPNQALEVVLGVRTPENPSVFALQGLKALRQLDVGPLLSTDLLAILYACTQGIIPKLESLNLTCTNIRVEDICRYKPLLSVYHRDVTLKQQVVRSPSWFR